MILETERLVLRNWLYSDIDCYMILSQDIGYNCFSPPGYFLVRSAEEAQAKIRDRMVLFDTCGLGKFPVFLRKTGEFIGTCGLEPFELATQPEVELGYRLCLKHWGRGYATEAAVAVLRYGFDVLHLQKIVAFALPQNVASLRILEKVGAVYLHEFVHTNLTHRLYDIPRSRFIDGDPFANRQVMPE
jgi:[ribosomal protein S5]-alanine N-acetyltransferase